MLPLHDSLAAARWQLSPATRTVNQQQPTRSFAVARGSPASFLWPSELPLPVYEGRQVLDFAPRTPVQGPDVRILRQSPPASAPDRASADLGGFSRRRLPVQQRGTQLQHAALMSTISREVQPQGAQQLGFGVGATHGLEAIPGSRRQRAASVGRQGLQRAAAIRHGSGVQCWRPSRETAAQDQLTVSNAALRRGGRKAQPDPASTG